MVHIGRQVNALSAFVLLSLLATRANGQNCATNYQETMPCCDQPPIGGVVSTTYICPSTRPLCLGYVYGVRWGSCTTFGTFGEFGSTSTTDAWRTVNLRKTYKNVVILSTITNRGMDTSSYRVQKLSESQFRVRVRECSGANGPHTTEIFHYVAMEAGNHYLSDGTQIAAGTVRMGQLFNGGIPSPGTPVANIRSSSMCGGHGGSAFNRCTSSDTPYCCSMTSQYKCGGVAKCSANGGLHWCGCTGVTYPFPKPFKSAPVVFLGVQSLKWQGWLVPRVVSTTTDVFTGFIQRDQRHNSGYMADPETVGWIAVDNKKEMHDGVSKLGTGYTPTAVMRNCNSYTRVDFGSDFPSPVGIARLWGVADGDPATIRHTPFSNTNPAMYFDACVQEDQSADSELSHGTEAVAWLVKAGGSGYIYEGPSPARCVLPNYPIRYNFDGTRYRSPAQSCCRTYSWGSERAGFSDSVEIYGWNYWRSYHKGLLRNGQHNAGPAKVTIKNLTPRRRYHFHVYQYASVHAGTNELTVNGGAGVKHDQENYRISTTTNLCMDTPTATGIAEADTAGKIRFEFKRVSWHVAISAIGLTPVDYREDCPTGTISHPILFDMSTGWGDRTLSYTSWYGHDPKTNLNYAAWGDLNGWTHTRNYHRGFLRNRAGQGRFRIRNLMPNTEYKYYVYQYATVYPGTNRLLPAPGYSTWSDTTTSTCNKPAATGIIRTDFWGQGNFYFNRIIWHVSLWAIGFEHDEYYKCPTSRPSHYAYFNFNNRGDTSLNYRGTYRYNSGGYQARLKGWTHTRRYQFGFLCTRTSPYPYIEIYNLRANWEYEVTIYQQCNHGIYSPNYRVCGTNRYRILQVSNYWHTSATTNRCAGRRSIKKIVRAGGSGRIKIEFYRDRSHVSVSALGVSHRYCNFPSGKYGYSRFVWQLDFVKPFNNPEDNPQYPAGSVRHDGDWYGVQNTASFPWETKGSFFTYTQYQAFASKLSNLEIAHELACPKNHQWLGATHFTHIHKIEFKDRWKWRVSGVTGGDNRATYPVLAHTLGVTIKSHSVNQAVSTTQLNSWLTGSTTLRRGGIAHDVDALWKYLAATDKIYTY